MKLELIIQSEVSQKEKHQYSMLLLLLNRFSHVQLCVTPWTAAYQASPSLTAKNIINLISVLTIW